MNPIKAFNMPEYLYQPDAAIHRLLKKEAPCTKIIHLRWGLPIEVDTHESIGRAISHHGLFEIAVVEALFRIISPGETVLDVGANIGFMSAAALAAGAGQVLSFEPHPLLFERLSRNIAGWNEQLKFKRITCAPAAVSFEVGTARLRFPGPAFGSNSGIASLEKLADQTASVEVATTTLDTIVGKKQIGVLKIDIEGHELQALRNQNSLRLIRDVIFEDHEGFASPVCSLLQEQGFVVFGLNKTPFGPALLDFSKSRRFLNTSNENLNFIATQDEKRLKGLFSPVGYRCLRRTIRQARTAPLSDA